MKFEQAFYTWGTEQMSFASKGLGICACSKNENSFIKVFLFLNVAKSPMSEKMMHAIAR